MVNLEFLFSQAPQITNWIGKLIYMLYEAIGNFGWTVVIFTLCLKLIVSPLDIWQKKVTRKNNIAMKRMEKPMAQLRDAYQDDPRMLQTKQMELYKQYGYSTFGACLPSLVTMIIFFVIFNGFNATCKYENQMMVYDLAQSYESLIVDTGLIDGKIQDLFLEDNKDAYDTLVSYGVNVEQYRDRTDFTDEEVDEFIDSIMLAAYDANSVTDKGVKKWEWLWVDNVFMGDSWHDTVPTLETYVGTGLGKLNSSLPDCNFRVRAKYNSNIYDALLKPAQTAYNKTKTFDIKNWNGYLILPLLSIALSILSTKLLRADTPKTQSYDANGNAIDTDKQMRMMNWFMPIMIGVFSLFYTAAFTIYMFFSSLITVIFNLIYNAVTKKKDAELEEGIIKR